MFLFFTEPVIFENSDFLKNIEIFVPENSLVCFNVAVLVLGHSGLKSSEVADFVLVFAVMLN